ncbi:hypothetical protein SCUCBS95973_005144 [Sporothrix curviconia]|uniref:Uncharacterized protein n=1 Tax=Sporothrix curviconia TaxID=1260050 RepID=A0ABP0BUI3_9PEZI
MCITWFHISYCETCRAYIDSHRVGTVFCAWRDANLPCQAEKSIDESAVSGPCTTCRPPPRLRRSQRIFMQARNYREASEDGESTDDETDRGTTVSDADGDSGDDGDTSAGGDDTDDGDDDYECSDDGQEQHKDRTT